MDEEKDVNVIPFRQQCTRLDTRQGDPLFEGLNLKGKRRLREGESVVKEHLKRAYFALELQWKHIFCICKSHDVAQFVEMRRKLIFLSIIRDLKKKKNNCNIRLETADK